LPPIGEKPSFDTRLRDSGRFFGTGILSSLATEGSGVSKGACSERCNLG